MTFELIFFLGICKTKNPIPLSETIGSILEITSPIDFVKLLLFELIRKGVLNFTITN
ncbi:hypothetical protein P872_01245 [Rhodonellum psychrophilum GCM71 = DSM 17998]|uniref:Uncharacterized protein n=1 Tax=Rhodonellum psychrophilum GCM71 = DSM 17998 TaxID=1123057 RepID=U5C1I8_9BACT|nr:hypothetical protein P872_01245 [Rhodonellum psychrophilum GCM71 = DSM 17998]